MKNARLKKDILFSGDASSKSFTIYREAFEKDYKLQIFLGHLSEKGKTISITDENGFLGLCFNLLSTVSYRSKGRPSRQFLKGQYNLIYTPKITWEYEKGEYTTVSIQVEYAFLKKMVKHYTGISEFLKKAERKELAQLSLRNMKLTHPMLTTIQDIIYNKFTGLARNAYVNSKIGQLIILSLHKFKSPEGKGTVSDQKKAQELREYLKKYLSNNTSGK